MRYFKIEMTDANGNKTLSDPICKWTDAEMYRREVLENGLVVVAILLSY